MNIQYTESDFTIGERNLDFLKKSLPLKDLYMWYYLPDGHLVTSSFPGKEKEEILEKAFTLVQGQKKAVEHSSRETGTRPLLISADFGLNWAVTFEKERNYELMVVIGPVFYKNVPYEQIRSALSPYLTTPELSSWYSRFRQLLNEIPVINQPLFLHDAILVHNTLNSDTLGPEAFFEIHTDRIGTPKKENETHDRHQVYLAEQALLKAVRDGDINYQNPLQHSMYLSSGTPVATRDPLRQAKTSITVFTTLVSRAAMESGLSPEIAYALGDSYIQAAEDCYDQGELTSITITMYHDFIYRVHHLRRNPGYSHTIQKCCDYIELSLDKKLRASDLAALTGYAEYYLTDKFKKETGMSISGYIRRTKLERSKTLLRSTNLSIQEISEQLAFTTPNYFAQCFKEDYGISPLQYRKNHQH